MLSLNANIFVVANISYSWENDHLKKYLASNLSLCFLNVIEQSILCEKYNLLLLVEEEEKKIYIYILYFL